MLIFDTTQFNEHKYNKHCCFYAGILPFTLSLIHSAPASWEATLCQELSQTLMRKAHLSRSLSYSL